MHWILWIFTLVAVVVSLWASWRATLLALKAGCKRMLKIAPLFLMVMAMYAICVTFIAKDDIQNTIGSDSGLSGLGIAMGIGSIAVMPGFVAFPLSAALKGNGVPLFILAGFSMTLMNVGIMTLPLERRYLSWKVTIIRNAIGLGVSFIVAIVIGFAFGEIRLPW